MGIDALAVRQRPDLIVDGAKAGDGVPPSVLRAPVPKLAAAVSIAFVASDL